MALFFAWQTEDRLYLVLCLVCLVMGSVTSYARAKGERLGFNAKTGLAERPDRLVGLLVPTFFGDLLGLPILYEVALWLLAARARSRSSSGSCWSAARRWPDPSESAGPPPQP